METNKRYFKALLYLFISLNVILFLLLTKIFICLINFTQKLECILHLQSFFIFKVSLKNIILSNLYSTLTQS